MGLIRRGFLCSRARRGVVLHRAMALGSLVWGITAFPAMAMPPLTDQAGDPARGFVLLVSSGDDGGNCLVCHVLTDPRIPEGFSGDVGPSLDGVGARMTGAQIRQQIVNPRLSDPDSLMPAYHVTEGLTNVATRYQNRPYLTAQEVEDITAYLETLQ